MTILATYEVFVMAVRTGLLYLGVIAAVIFAVDWAVRTRRINPFSRTARFFRGRVDPLITPVERVVLRAGGNPGSAPWWALVAFIVMGILLISLLQFVGAVLTQVIFGIQNPGSLPKLVLSWAFGVLRLAILVRVLSSWFPVSPYSRWVRWSYLLTDWFIVPLSRVIPRIGMIDITPLVAWFLLSLIQGVFSIP